MLSDPTLPSVVKLVGGPKVKGSWWGHPKGHEIFQKLGWLESRPDVLATRLVSGKVTYLHERLWAEFLSVATSREDWQTRGLSSGEGRLLRMVDVRGEVRTDRAGARYRSGDARELERRLLVSSEEIHTESGSHAKLLATWSNCAKVKDLRIHLPAPEAARRSLENLLDELNQRYSGKGYLPWRGA